MGWNLVVPYPKWSSSPVSGHYWYDAFPVSRAGSRWLVRKYLFGTFCPEMLVRKSLSGNLCPESLVRRNLSMARITSFHRVPHMVTFSPWKSAPVCHAVHPERTLSTSGYFQALIFIFNSFDFARGAASWGFVLLVTCIHSIFWRLPWSFCPGAPIMHPLVTFARPENIFGCWYQPKNNHLN